LKLFRENLFLTATSLVSSKKLVNSCQTYGGQVSSRSLQNQGS